MTLSVRDLRVSFPSPDGPVAAVDGISFDVEPGEFFLVIGESGSGKSLTGSAILGLGPANATYEGSIRYDGQELLNAPERTLRDVRGRKIGVVYQDPLSAMNPVWPVGDQIAETLTVHGLADRRTARARAVALLDQVRVPDPNRVAKAYPHEISGGMRQRAMIAMALACGPGLLIADEPTTALDVTIKAQVLELLAELRREMSLTVILITHDMGVVAELADRILVMYAGRVAEIGGAADVLDNPKHPYTRALLDCVSISDAPFKSELNAISGTAPSLAARPAGCRFHPRCPYAQADCTEIVPALRPLNGSMAACHHPLSLRENVEA
jgi:oligopeptide/dipeptide ABC transporter ATP-binding protein